MKYALALAVLFLAPLAHADTINVTATGTTCESCFGSPTPEISYNLSMVVEQIAGDFFFPFYGAVILTVEDEVVSLTGEINGDAVTLSQAPEGDGSCLYANQEFGLGAIYFDASGQPAVMFNDNENNLLSSAFGAEIPLEWNAVDPPNAVETPEPGILLLCGIGIVVLWIMKKRAAQVSC